MTCYGDPPAGFREAIGAGDSAFREGLLAGAAVWYGRAYELAAWIPMSPEALEYGSEAGVRVEMLLGACVLPALGGVSSRGEDDRWVALRTVAEQGLLAESFPTGLLRVTGMVRRPAACAGERSRENEESDRAWGVLMACPRLVAPAFSAIDRRLVIEGLHRHRAELAMHRSADGNAWLGMLERWRTPDLVHTLWELPRAMVDERVRAAVSAPSD